MQSRLPLSPPSDHPAYHLVRLFQHNKLHWKSAFVGTVVAVFAFNHLNSDQVCRAAEFGLATLFVCTIFRTEMMISWRSGTASPFKSLLFALACVVAGPALAWAVNGGLNIAEQALVKFAQVVLESFPTDFPLVQSAVTLLTDYSTPISALIMVGLSIAWFRYFVTSMLVTTAPKLPNVDRNFFSVVLSLCFCLPACLSLAARACVPAGIAVGQDFACYEHAMNVVGFVAAFIVMLRLSYVMNLDIAPGSPASSPAQTQ